MATAKEMRAQTSTRAQLYAPVIKLYASSGGGVEKKKQAGPGHVGGSTGPSGAGHGQAGEQAVEAIPGEQGAARVQTQ